MNNKLARRKEKYEKRKRELERLLAKTIDYKARVLRFEQDALAEYRLGKISYEEYKRVVSSKIEEKTLDDWNRYYDDYIENCKKEIEIVTAELKAIEKEDSTGKTWNYALWGTAIAVMLALAFVFGPAITGFVTSQANVTVLNVAPNVTSLSIAPEPIYSNITAVCNPITEDWNLDTVSVHWRWFVNRSAILAGPYQKITYNVNYLHHGNYSANTYVVCQATPTDGLLNGTAKNATSLVDGFGPEVIAVEIADNGTNFNYVVTPVAGRNASVAIRATIIHPACSGETNVTAYICDTTIANECNTSRYNYTQSLRFQRVVTGSTCYFTYNGTSNMPQFWRTPGTWNWNLTVRAIDNNTENLAYARTNYTNFTYNSLQAINYRTRLYLGNSSGLVLGKWATNSTAVNLSNYGNVRLKLQWNASNPRRIGGGGLWTINRDFQIDDDRNYTDTNSDTYLRVVNLTTPTLQMFNQTSGLQTCLRDNCNTGVYKTWTRNETLETYFHIKPPLGLPSGTYSSKIWIVTAAA